VPLDSVSVRVLADSVRLFVADCSAVRNSSVDVGEANRILSRKYSGRNWPPSSYSPHSSHPRVVPRDDVVDAVDYAAVALDWLNVRGDYDPKVSDMVESICTVGKRMGRAQLEAALVELEALNVVEVVKKVTGSRGPRPRAARLYMWVYDAMRDGCPVSIADARARADGGGLV
jgi:hypothetical protein